MTKYCFVVVVRLVEMETWRASRHDDPNIKNISPGKIFASCRDLHTMKLLAASKREKF